MGASNLHYHDFEAHFAVAREAVAFGTPGATPKTWPVIGTPRVRIEPNFLDSAQTGRGRAERNQDEFDMGNIDAGGAFACRMGNVFWYELLVSLLQMRPAGVETPALSGKFKHTFTVYNGQPSANFGLTIWNALRAGVTNDARRAAGNVVKSLKASSAENQQARLDVDTIALSGIRATLASPGSAWSNALQHLHRHLVTAKIGGVAIDPAPASVEFTAVNNPVPWNGRSQTPTEIVLGIFNLTGQFEITARNIGMAEFDAYNNRTNRTLNFGWGTAVDDVGYVEAIFDATYNSFEPTSHNGIQAVTLGFVSALAATSPQATTFNVWHSADLSV